MGWFKDFCIDMRYPILLLDIFLVASVFHSLFSLIGKEPTGKPVTYVNACVGFLIFLFVGFLGFITSLGWSE